MGLSSKLTHNKNGVLWSQARMSFEMRLRWDLVIRLSGRKSINKCNQTTSKLILEKTNDNRFWFTTGSIGHWKLVIKNKSFERVLKNVEELKSVCNECLKQVFVMRLIESVWDENVWDNLRWEYLRVFVSVLNENLSVLECSRMF